jgi:lipoprotein-anchoring transpeptidase ErfK/SrfK
MTNKPSPRSPFLQAIHAGCDALARGDRATARMQALQAVAIDPLAEEAWLLLAALAAPRNRAPYLDHLLLIHPESDGARRALAELAAGGFSATSADSGIGLPSPEEILKAGAAPVAASEQKRPPKKSRAPQKAASNVPAQPAYRKRGVRWGVLLLAASCLLGLTATAFVNVVSRAQELPILARVAKDAGTPVSSFTPSFTPTITPSFTPTFTLTFTPSPTNTATATLPPPTVDAFIAYPGGNGERWIDVDISAQRVTAYAGNSPVATFIVSTGVAAHPTVLGRYRIYVKYRYDDMAGPGYYLPNVPFVMYFYEGYSLHGTYWHHNFGTPMSHGCVNMRTSEAEWMYYWASVGTVVNVHW